MFNAEHVILKKGNRRLDPPIEKRLASYELENILCYYKCKAQKQLKAHKNGCQRVVLPNLT